MKTRPYSKTVDAIEKLGVVENALELYRPAKVGRQFDSESKVDFGLPLYRQLKGAKAMLIISLIGVMLTAAQFAVALYDRHNR